MHRRIMRSLMNEHRNMQHVLTLLRLHLDALTPGDVYGLRSICNAIGYMRQVPQFCHHPREELIFQRLMPADRQITKHRRELRRQHLIFEATEPELMCDIAVSRAGEADACSRIKGVGATYRREHADHIGLEEKQVFPAAVQILPFQEWLEIYSQAVRLYARCSGAGRYRGKARSTTRSWPWSRRTCIEPHRGFARRGENPGYVL